MSRLSRAVVVVLCAILLMAQTAQKTVTVIYAPSDPTTPTCKPGQTWQNTTASTLFGCNVNVNPPAWQSLGAASGPTTFPVTATSGDTTVELLGLAAARIASLYSFDVSDGASTSVGINGTLANLGALMSAFVGTNIASHSVNVAGGVPAVTTVVTNGTRTVTEASTPNGGGRLYSLLVSGPSSATSEAYVPSDAQYAILTSNLTGTSTFLAIAGITATWDVNNATATATVAVTPGLTTATVDDAGGSSTSQNFSPEGWAFPYRSPVTLSLGAINPRANVYRVTMGGLTMTTITAPLAGTCHTLIFNDGGDVAEGGNINLSASPFTVTASDTLQLCSDGTTWFEVARSVN